MNNRDGIVRQIRQLATDGLQGPAIARLLGMTRNQVSGLAHRHAIPLPGPARRPA